MKVEILVITNNGEISKVIPCSNIDIALEKYIEIAKIFGFEYAYELVKDNDIIGIEILIDEDEKQNAAADHDPGAVQRSVEIDERGDQPENHPSEQGTSDKTHASCQ